LTRRRLSSESSFQNTTVSVAVDYYACGADCA
jgi:hypothetical protein